MNSLKNYNFFVSEQTEDFFDDFETSKKNIKLFTSFAKASPTYEKTDIKFTEPKKRFQSKIKIMSKKNSKNIF